MSGCSRRSVGMLPRIIEKSVSQSGGTSVMTVGRGMKSARAGIAEEKFTGTSHLYRQNAIVPATGLEHEALLCTL